MAVCINKNSVQYQSLKNRAGIPEFILEAVSRDFMEKYGRLPHLDELPNSNSEPYLRDQLDITKHNSAKVESILEMTGKETVEEAVVDINNQFRDLETTIIPINKEALVDITHRPTENNFEVTPIQQDVDVNSYLVLNNALHKLASLHGITFNDITDSELNSEKWRNIMPDGSLVNAFIYDGQIYINLDRSSVDAPIHEMFHMFVGSLRFTNPTLYQELVESVQSFPNYEKLVQEYPGRTRNDVNEEILVTEVSKYLTGQPSSLAKMDSKTRYEISYNIKRMLDTILMGQDSVKTISEDRLFNLSLKEIAQEVNSAVMVNNFTGTMNVEGSELHRRLNNVKSDLYKEGTLEEYCD